MTASFKLKVYQVQSPSSFTDFTGFKLLAKTTGRSAL